MNEAEFEQWLKDAATCLACRYSKDEVETIMWWFRRIKGSDERRLIGKARLEAMSVFTEGPQWSLYDSLMARLWVYAPYILKQKELDVDGINFPRSTN